MHSSAAVMQGDGKPPGSERGLPDNEMLAGFQLEQPGAEDVGLFYINRLKDPLYTEAISGRFCTELAFPRQLFYIFMI